MVRNVQGLAQAAPSTFNEVKAVDWEGVAEAMRAVGVASDDVVAATWCQLGHHNIEALVDAPQLVMIHPRGVLATIGKRKMFGGSVKYDGIDFARVRGYGPEDQQDPRGIGKFCIEFAAAGGVPLGRLQWAWRGKRFKNNMEEIVAVAEERDRILGVVGQLMG